MMHTQQRYFYWFQDDDHEKDAENCKKVHNILNGITEETKEDKPAEAASGPALTQQ